MHLRHGFALTFPIDVERRESRQRVQVSGCYDRCCCSTLLGASETVQMSAAATHDRRRLRGAQSSDERAVDMTD